MEHLDGRLLCPSYGLTQGWDQRRAGNLAAAAAAKLVTSLGPRIRGEETQAVLRTFL